MKQAMPDELKRALRKLARRLAERNSYRSSACIRTFADDRDVFKEAARVIQKAGLEDEYERRLKQCEKARMG